MLAVIKIGVVLFIVLKAIYLLIGVFVKILTGE